MLARLDPRHLGRIWFPLGEQSKEETRAEAERAGLAVARRAESQEACFLGGGDYRDFLERHGLPAQRGADRGRSGRGGRRPRRLLALHAGPAARPRRVHRAADATRCAATRETNTVVVGPREALARSTVEASGRLFASVTRGDAKLRYRSPAVPADVEADAGGFQLRFDEPAYGVAAGQTAVVYEGDAVVGSGTIASSAP